MKMRLMTIPMSAYLSMMLVSSLAPISDRFLLTTASPIDPVAAQQAFDKAMTDLESKTWRMSATDAPAVSQVAVFNPQVVNGDPVMTDELLARLIKLIRTDKVGSVSYKLCKVLELCDGTTDLPMQIGKSDSKDGEHYLGVPPAPDSTDILIVIKRGTTLEAFLTDKSCKLRAAAILENGVARLLVNEKVEAKFQKELSLFAGEAKDLPPTGTAVAGNS